jgi:hypothetical protein
MPEPANPGREITAFAHVLRQIDKGTVDARLSEALADASAAAVTTRKPATVTLVLTVAPAVKASDTDPSVTLDAKITTKLPSEQASALFYATEDGTLTRNDPRQPALPISLVKETSA